MLQVSGLVQVPQLAVRMAPQLSAAVSEPHALDSRVQNAAFDSGWQWQVPIEQN